MSTLMLLPQASDPAAGPPPAASAPLAMKLLPFVLSLVAGSVDAISFLGLGLFAAHITGNLVILSAHIVSGNPAQTTQMLAVPVFMAMLILVRLLATRLQELGRSPLRPLLLLQVLFLTGFLCLTAGRPVDAGDASFVIAGMLGVSAMAVQNALVQISLTGIPSTAVMTTNVTRFTMDVSEMLLGRNPAGMAEARVRAMRTWPPIVGFAIGCGAGAAIESAIGLWSLALPAGLALLAFAMA